MKLNNFDDYIKTRLSAEEIEKIKKEALSEFNEHINNMSQSDKFEYDSRQFAVQLEESKSTDLPLNTEYKCPQGIFVLVHKGKDNDYWRKIE